MTFVTDDNALGIYLRDRRARIDPAALGLPATRRRTPGLRREEVAQRAHISATWYTWLEQGRGGAPSADVLDRLARALSLTGAEREHLYLLAQRRPPETRGDVAERLSPSLQCVLDALEFCPAIVKNNVWDIVGWNRAAAAILTDYDAIPPERRNALRLLFTDPRLREIYPHWEADARFAVAVFRADTARTGASKRASKLVAELRRLSKEFDEMWSDNDVRLSTENTKSFTPPGGGRITLEYSSFGVDGQPSLTLMILTPATPVDAATIRSLACERPVVRHARLEGAIIADPQRELVSERR